MVLIAAELVFFHKSMSKTVASTVGGWLNLLKTWECHLLLVTVIWTFLQQGILTVDLDYLCLVLVYWKTLFQQIELYFELRVPTLFLKVKSESPLSRLIVENIAG
jgi:hypothetical protein